MTPSTDDIDITIQYGGQFTEQINNGEPDAYTGIKISVGDIYLYGSADRWPRNWVVYLVNAFLEATPAVISDEKEIVTNHNGPSYFVFEPYSDTAVQLVHVLTYEGIDDPDERRPFTDDAIIEKRQLLEELVETGDELHDRILEINPGLASHDDIELLESNLEVGRRQLAELENTSNRSTDP